jgi:hypothetical protein
MAWLQLPQCWLDFMGDCCGSGGIGTLCCPDDLLRVYHCTIAISADPGCPTDCASTEFDLVFSEVETTPLPGGGEATTWYWRREPDDGTVLQLTQFPDPLSCLDSFVPPCNLEAGNSDFEINSFCPADLPSVTSKFNPITGCHYTVTIDAP